MDTARNHVTDLRGASRLAIGAIAALTGVVEAMHANIARRPTQQFGGRIGTAANRTAGIVYESVRGVTRAIGAGLDLALGAVAPAFGHVKSSPAREGFVAALNGVLGDYLAETHNPLAITMRLRRNGKPLELTRQGLAASIRAPSSKVLVLVHGLCRSERGWRRKGHDHGAALARDLSYTALYLHYNSGLHISTNGRAFAELLEALVAAWPRPLTEVSIVAHSMGGLVTRSAYHYGSNAGHKWPGRLRKVVFLGTPHDGAALERLGHQLDLLWEKTPYIAPLARLGRVRSAGITDLRRGYVLDEDWRGHDRFARRADPRRPLPLPDTVQCYAVAATLTRSAAPVREHLIGDGLVSVPSALGKHRDPRLALTFPQSHQWTVFGANHLDLLSRSDVYQRIRGWLA
jgi:hypothetical protein